MYIYHQNDHCVYIYVVSIVGMCRVVTWDVSSFPTFSFFQPTVSLLVAPVRVSTPDRSYLDV